MIREDEEELFEQIPLRKQPHSHRGHLILDEAALHERNAMVTEVMIESGRLIRGRSENNER